MAGVIYKADGMSEPGKISNFFELGPKRGSENTLRDKRHAQKESIGCVPTVSFYHHHVGGKYPVAGSTVLLVWEEEREGRENQVILS